MKFIFSFLLFGFIITLNSTAQVDSKLINIDEVNFNLFSAKPSEKANHNTFVVWFKKPIKNNLNILRQVSEFCKIIFLQNLADTVLFKNDKFCVANNLWKYAPTLTNNKNLFGKYSFIISGENLHEINFSLKGCQLVRTVESGKTVIIHTSKNFIENNILTLSNVSFVDLYVKPKTEVNIIGFNSSFHSNNVLLNKIPEANGKNIVVGVKEQNMQALDLDIFKRVIPSTLAASNVQDHATVIASIIGGAGNSFYNGKGIANACKFYSSSFSNLFADDANVLQQNNVSLQNHSYGTIVQQFYGAEAKSYDDFLWGNKNFLHIFSAGNKGVDAATQGPYAGINNFANLTGNFKMSKNVITVAAIDGSGVVANESSAGPTYDGRLAPQLTALGPNGTSDAAAMVTGAAAVLQQVYADSNNNNKPSADLVKALLFNTADDINKTNIDYKTGYGLLNSYEAVLAMQQKRYASGFISNNGIWLKNILIPAQAANVKVTLVWTDTAATLNNNKALINDLDLELKEISTGIIYKPWVLSNFPRADSLNKIAVRKRDSLNNAEQITIDLPNAGLYEIKVLGTNVVNNNLPFSIAFGIDTLNEFSFLNPQNSNDLNIQENESINVKWKLFVADTANQLGTLAITYNEGNTWQNIGLNIKLYKRQFLYTIKDTSTTAQMRIQTSFGTFFSNKFIISRPIRTEVDFVCSDSFRLSWNKHILATSYKVYGLVDSPYLKPIFTTTDTFKVFNRNNFTSNVYAVEPILQGGYEAVRSVAIDINEQAVNCFYKVLTADLLEDNSAKLTLTLSINEYVDSIFFEEVNSASNFVRNISSVKINTFTNIYEANSGVLNFGKTYFRCKIKLKHGAFVYTDVQTLLSSGDKKIIFYPNPVSLNSTLNYTLQTDLFGDNSIYFYDATGKYLKGFKTLPNSFKVTNFPTGVIFYKLQNTKTGFVEKGKLVINP
jgi:hypothetical protein